MSPKQGRRLANHNSKILKSHTQPTEQVLATCNCQKSRRDECPMPGECTQRGVVYEAVVSTNDGNVESYVGLAKYFKSRYLKHRTTLRNEQADGQTTLSNFVWEQRKMRKEPKIKWRYLERNIPDFNPVTGICRLCIREKFQIVLNPSVASLNQRTEMFFSCRSRDFYRFYQIKIMKFYSFFLLSFNFFLVLQLVVILLLTVL